MMRTVLFQILPERSGALTDALRLLIEKAVRKLPALPASVEAEHRRGATIGAVSPAAPAGVSSKRCRGSVSENKCGLWVQIPLMMPM